MSAGNEIVLKMPEGSLIEGSNPVVVIGPNGSGKTQYGIKLGRNNNAQFIAALRNIELQENIPMLGLSQVEKQLESLLKNQYRQRGQMSNEINHLFSKLLAENSSSAIGFRDAYCRGESPEVEDTKLMRLRKMWKHLFPGRDINFSSYSPKVNSEYMKGEYIANHMSDGERVALYLGARVLEAEPGVVIVDEPEIHFHSRLAVRFWNELEALRPDLRFVYITHDLPFALSRQDPKFIIVKPNESPQIIEEDKLPSDIAESLLGAASLSIYASRVVFCEGREGKTSDHSLYSAWFSGRDTVVVPVGSCRDVLNCTESFCKAGLVNGVKAIGIVDRDYWPDEFFDKLPEEVFALPVHEIENIYCTKDVFLAVANHLGRSESDAEDKYRSCLDVIRSKFNNGSLNQQISQRFRRRCEGVMRSNINKLKTVPNTEEMKKTHISSMEPKNWELDPNLIFEEESERISDALNGDVDDLMKYLPGKSMLGHAAKTLGITTDTYRGLVDSTLQSSESSKFQEALIETLSTILPDRNQPDDKQQSQPD